MAIPVKKQKNPGMAATAQKIKPMLKTTPKKAKTPMGMLKAGMQGRKRY